MSLKNRTVGALSWSLLQEAAQRIIQLGIGILLARLLLPAEFGLIAMLTVFIAVAQVLLDSGFVAALIQRKEVSDLDQNSVFYFNILMSLVLATGLCVAAPWIAEFYHQPQLTSLTRWLSAILVINALVVVQSALLIRQLNFKRLTLIATASTAVSGVVGLALAWRGFGVWSLVGQQLAASTMRACLYWRFNKWRPRWIFSAKALREMFAFGSGMAASSVVNTLFENLYALVIGKLFSAAALGFYSRAETLQNLPAQSLASVVGRVTFPVFSSLQGDIARLRNGLRKAITSITFLHFPLMIGLAAVARPLVLLLLTDKWAPSVPYLQLLCFVGLWYPLHLLNLNALLAVGRSGLFFRLEVIKKLLTVLNVLITFRWGIQAMICGQIVNSLLCFFINSYYSKRFVGYSTWQQMRDVSPCLGAAAAMGLVVAFIHVPVPFAHLGQLGFKVFLGLSIYGGLALFFGFPALGYLQEMLHARRAGWPEDRAPATIPVQ